MASVAESGPWLAPITEIAGSLSLDLKSMNATTFHHTFSYLDTPSRVTAWLIRIAGPEATHIVLSPGMAKRLVWNYPRAHRTISVSNAIFLPDKTTSGAQVRQRLGIIGFLSNISAEKGVFEFLDLCRVIQDMGLDIRAVLAGPFQDTKIERQVRQRLLDLSRVSYVGSQYGEQKDAFFAGIDALVFPTRNEAEPLVIHEAMGQSIPVITYGRGCIPDIVSSACGLVVPPGDAFVPAAIAQIDAWLANPQAFQAASIAASARFNALYSENLHRWEELKSELLRVGSDIPTARAPH